jgi:hypothetical protein
MKDIDDFAVFVRDTIGLPVTAEDMRRDLDQVSGWDSIHLLWLVTALERDHGRTVSVPDVVKAATLAEIYELAVAG